MKYPVSAYAKALQVRLGALTNPAMYKKLPERIIPSDVPYKVAIGPVNFAGQAYEWSVALNQRCPDISAISMAFSTGSFEFPVHEEISIGSYRLKRWQKAQLKHLSSEYTHVISEAGRAMCGNLLGSRATPIEEVERFTRAGVKVGHIAHGSDIRRPSFHLANYPNSPFNDPNQKMAIETLENRSKHLIQIFQRSPRDTFVTTPDLFDYLPEAKWLPVVVNVERWQTEREVNLIDKPRVLFAPSKSWIKGGDSIDQTLENLERRGLITYTRVHGIPSERMPSLIEASDIVIDQLALGAYGLMAVQAMAAGRLVVGHVAPHVRERIQRQVPIVEASAESLGAVLEDIVSQPSNYRDFIVNGRSFVSQFHDGEYSSRVLGTWIKSN